MDAVEEIKSRLALEDVAAEYVQLKRSGRNFKALSPFSNEKSPSFMVSPEKQIWHDFSSNKGGNMFSLVMEMEGVDFKGALDILARKAGLDLGQFQRGDNVNTERKKRLYGLLELATKFYQAQLKGSRDAVEYVLKKRRFTPETSKTFRLGYSPNGGEALVKFVRSKGYTDKEIKDAGLGTMRRRGFSDMFIGRIMVPLMDPQGLVIGFTARLLIDDPNAPKYINTPQTILYDKSRHVYGLAQAKEAIRKSKFVVVAEGNLDVISSWQADAKNIVATAGTAMTLQHLKTLVRFVPDIRLAYDQDKAGQTATERAIGVAQGLEITLSMINIPSGKDPDELIRQDPKIWHKAIDHPLYALDWLIERYVAQNDMSSAQGKIALTDAVLIVISYLTDTVEQEHYLKKLSEIADVPIDAVRSKLLAGGDGKNSKTKLKHVDPALLQTKITDTSGPLQDCLLALALVHKSLRQDLGKIPKAVFKRADREHVYAYLIKHSQETDVKSIAQDLKTEEDYVKILLLQYDELYADVPSAEISEEFGKVRARALEQYVRNEKQTLHAEIVEAERSGRDYEYLLKLQIELDNLLKDNLSIERTLL